MKTYETIRTAVDEYADAACQNGKRQSFIDCFGNHVDVRGYGYATGSLIYMLRRAIEMLPEAAQSDMLAALSEDTLRHLKAVRESV